jgi:hypothetical protein
VSGISGVETEGTAPGNRTGFYHRVGAFSLLGSGLCHALPRPNDPGTPLTAPVLCADRKAHRTVHKKHNARRRSWVVWDGATSIVGELPLYGVLGSSLPASNLKQRQKYAIWGMCLALGPCYGGDVIQRGGADEPRPFGKRGPNGWPPSW